MAYKDGGTFTTYCDKDYDRHTYTIVFTNNKKITYTDYDSAKYYWYLYKDRVSHIEVIDKKSEVKGF